MMHSLSRASYFPLRENAGSVPASRTAIESNYTSLLLSSSSLGLCSSGTRLQPASATVSTFVQEVLSFGCLGDRSVGIVPEAQIIVLQRDGSFVENSARFAQLGRCRNRKYPAL